MNLYPVTVVKTRYSGVYEGGRWAAFPVEAHDVPMQASDDDVTCMMWWAENGDYVGIGVDPIAAIEDLESKIETIPEYAEMAPGVFKTRWGAWK